MAEGTSPSKLGDRFVGHCPHCQGGALVVLQHERSCPEMVEARRLTNMKISRALEGNKNAAGKHHRRG